MHNQEISITDPTQIALYLCAGIPSVRREFKNRILSYIFPRLEVEKAIETFGRPDMDIFRKYVETLKAVQAEISASRQASKLGK